MGNFYEYVRKFIDTLVAIIFAIMTVIVFVQVIMRYVFNNSLDWVDETSRYLFVWLIYLGGTITIRTGKMVSFDLFLEACKGTLGKIMHVLVTVICILFLGFIVIWGTRSLIITNGEMSPIVGYNMVLIKSVIPFGCLLMIIEEVMYCVNHWNDKDNEEAQQTVKAEASESEVAAL